jgi:branched-chain amino acid transport system ATP-binding protein
VLAGLLKTPAYRRSEQKALDDASDWLSRVGLRDSANRPAGSLAYGQQRRLEVARCMMTRPRLLMLDEPAAGLNARETAELTTLVEDLRHAHGVTVLLIEHDMKLVMGLSDRIVVINQGVPLAEGTPDDIRNDPAVIKAYLGDD